MAGGRNTGYRIPRNDARAAQSNGLGKIAGKSTPSKHGADSHGGVMQKRLPDLQQLKKWKERFDEIKKLIDEETRPAQIFKEGTSLIGTVLDKIFKNATKHPYFIFHKVHLDILQAFIQSVTTQEFAQKHLEKATKLAKAGSEEAEKWLKDYHPQRGQKMKEFKELNNKIYGYTFAQNVSRNNRQYMSQDYRQYEDDIPHLNDRISTDLRKREDMLEHVFIVYAQLCIEEKLVQEAMKQHDALVKKLKNTEDWGFSSLAGHQQEKNERGNAVNLIYETGAGNWGPNNIIHGAVGSVHHITQRLLVEVEKQNHRLNKKI